MELLIENKLVELDPDFGKMAGYIGNHAWGLPDLTMREKAFVFIAGDLCSQNLQMPLEVHVKVGVLNGVALGDFREAVRHLAPYAGYPTAALAMMRLAQIEREIAALPGPRQAEPAPETPGVELPEQAAADLERLDPHFAEFYRGQFAERWGRGGLNSRERALATLAVDVMYQTLDEPFALHLDLARRAGAGETQIRQVITLISEYGTSRAWRAFRALEAHLAASTASVS
jgi:alkylhydroperoxidase/carboxymuconolactone decarboxylase family protein YurZ